MVTGAGGGGGRSAYTVYYILYISVPGRIKVGCAACRLGTAILHMDNGFGQPSECTRACANQTTAVLPTAILSICTVPDTLSKHKVLYVE